MSYYSVVYSIPGSGTYYTTALGYSDLEIKTLFLSMGYCNLQITKCTVIPNIEGMIDRL